MHLNFYQQLPDSTKLRPLMGPFLFAHIQSPKPHATRRTRSILVNRTSFGYHWAESFNHSFSLGVMDTMPRLNTLESFGDEYEQLLLRVHEALENQKEYAVQFDESGTASSMRTRVYQYFKALRNSTSRPDLTALCTNVSLRTAGAALVFFHSSDTTDKIALRKALGLSDGFADGTDTRGVIAPQSGLSSHLDKLASIRSRKNNAK
jgi:hypothetical protein